MARVVRHRREAVDKAVRPPASLGRLRETAQEASERGAAQNRRVANRPGGRRILSNDESGTVIRLVDGKGVFVPAHGADHGSCAQQQAAGEQRRRT